MDVFTLLIAGVVLIVAFLWFQRADPRLPPCPVQPLPIVGHFFHLKEDTRPLFQEWRQKCGDIYSIYMGGAVLVVLNGYDLIKETLIKRPEVFSDRPPYFVDYATGIPDGGVIFSNGEIWKEQRTVTLAILRAFGMGRNLLAQKIEEEVVNYVGYLRNLEGEPTDLLVKTSISTSNVICSILIGHRFEYDDTEFQDLVHQLNSQATDQQNVSLINLFFWLRHIPGDLFKAKQLTGSVQAMLKMLKKFIDAKKTNVEDTNEVCDLIDAYIIERNKKIKAGLSTTLDDNSLLKIMNDLFGAGTETTSTTIYWCVLYMLNNPDVQEKVYQEINDNVGKERLPSIQDRTNLTYLNAVIAETQRLASLVPMSLPHMTSEEVTVRGYTLPKGTHILPNLDSVLHDTTTWGEDALSFRPERFIDDNGKLNIPEQFIPFSAGRRVCLGESLAKMELFLFLASMFQKFEFLPPTPGIIPPLKYVCGVVIAPKPYKVRAVKRK
jgi:cytochrome P450